MTTGVDSTASRTPPARPARPRVIVCERTGRWAVALRRELGDAAVRLHETRSLADSWDMLHRFPASFVVVELTRGNADALLARLAMLERHHPRARVAIVAERELLHYQELLREAGAAWFVVSPRQLTPLVQAVGRHLEQVPSPQLSLAEQVWAELPWGRPE